MKLEGDFFQLESVLGVSLSELTLLVGGRKVFGTVINVWCHFLKGSLLEQVYEKHQRAPCGKIPTSSSSKVPILVEIWTTSNTYEPQLCDCGSVYRASHDCGSWHRQKIKLCDLYNIDTRFFGPTGVQTPNWFTILFPPFFAGFTCVFDTTTNRPHYCICNNRMHLGSARML